MEVTLVEWFDDHWYKVSLDGKTHYLPSVTTKLSALGKPGIDKWRGDIGNREADLRMYEAQNRGKRIHAAWEVALKGGAVIYDPWDAPIYTEAGIADLKKKYNDNVFILRTQDEMFQVAKLKKHFDLLKPQVLGIELRVYDIQNKDAGTIDGVYQIEEGNYEIAGRTKIHLPAGIIINDLKTGNVVDDSVWLQLAPYAKMYEDLYKTKVVGAMVTHTGAKTKTGIIGLNTMFRDRKTLMEKDYPDFRRVAALWERTHEDVEPELFQFPALIDLKGETK